MNRRGEMAPGTRVATHPSCRLRDVRISLTIYIGDMTRRLVEIDDDVLAAASGALGTTTIKDTVDLALRNAAEERRAALQAALDDLAAADFTDFDRAAAWR